VQPDLRLTATVAPGLALALPIGVELEAAVCKATATLKPSVAVHAPIRLDPWHAPPVYWDGLCVNLGTTLNLGLTCCEIGFSKSVNLFDPIQVGNCPNQALLAGEEEEEIPMAPPRHAALAYGPAGYAVAVWEHYEHEPNEGGRMRTAPVYSVFDGSEWTEPALLAGPEYAGWEPQVGFLDGGTVVVAWSVPGTDEERVLAGSAGPRPAGVCDSVSSLIELGCGVVGTVVKGVKTVVKTLCPFCRTTGDNDGEPRFLDQGPGLNVRPVLATNPATGDAVLVW
ncbi:MAG: hypothetical protein KDM81_21790, partial [Verrucomicrobiae bacterium]|nr:hypothetical protein [Verrucomicrobiae bacterium]